jgi:hypothetical protein
MPEEISTLVHSFKALKGREAGHVSLGASLKKALAYLPKLKDLSFAVDGSRSAWNLKIALNSARLLTWILGATFGIVVLVAAITSIAATGDDELIDLYQRHYSKKMSLELEFESLRQEQARLMALGSGSLHNSAVVSAFCQKGVGSVYLNRILIRNTPGDSSLVELSGSAKNEASIFRYHELLSRIVEPYRLSINSIQPEVTGSRGVTDTTLTFKMSVKVDVEKR